MAGYAASIAEDEAVEAAAMGLVDDEAQTWSGAERFLGDQGEYEPCFEDLDGLDNEDEVPHYGPGTLLGRVVVRCKRCSERGVRQPPALAVMGTWREGERWTVLRRIERPRVPEGEKELLGLLAARYPHWAPRELPEVAADVDRRRAVLLAEARAHEVAVPGRALAPSGGRRTLAADLRAPFIEAPEDGRFTIDCGRGHRAQTTARALRRLAERAFAEGATVSEATL